MVQTSTKRSPLRLRGALFLHADALGSIVARTEMGGAVSGSRQYDAWGKTIAGFSDSGYAFQGREWDQDARLYFNRARFVDPDTGRFISEDPIAWSGGMNFYQFVENRPTRFTDPTGWKWGDPDDEDTCLTCILFAEAGGSPECQVAVASVIVNRMAKNRRDRPGRSASICDVVKQAWQFEGYDNPNYRNCATCSVPNRIPEMQKVLDFGNFDVIPDVTNFHDDRVKPSWSTDRRTTVIKVPGCVKLKFYKAPFPYLP